MNVYLFSARNVFLAALAAAAISGCNQGGSDGGSGSAVSALVSSLAPASIPVGSYLSGGNIRVDVKPSGVATITINGVSNDYNCQYTPNGSVASLSGTPVGTGGGGSPFTAALTNWMASGGNITSVQATGLPNVPSTNAPSATTLTAGGTPIPSPGTASGNSSGTGSQTPYPVVPSDSPLYDNYKLLQSIRQSKPNWTNPPLPPSGTGVLPPLQYGYEIASWASTNARKDGDTQAADAYATTAQSFLDAYNQLKPKN